MKGNLFFVRLNSKSKELVARFSSGRVFRLFRQRLLFFFFFLHFQKINFILKLPFYPPSFSTQLSPSLFLYLSPFLFFLSLRLTLLLSHRRYFDFRYFPNTFHMCAYVNTHVYINTRASYKKLLIIQLLQTVERRVRGKGGARVIFLFFQYVLARFILNGFLPTNTHTHTHTISMEYSWSAFFCTNSSPPTRSCAPIHSPWCTVNTYIYVYTSTYTYVNTSSTVTGSAVINAEGIQRAEFFAVVINTC